ncbi:MAG: mandelate racemase/muconate lactonizing enzyme family protein [Alphaproteobacteria bacterium]|nr:mandelate racemase/muconate lactonizing enzyme family protein [Alphaproteobacteria bacterium]MBU0802845.1 mandelate racemase/muconate lactonizing enzyme family protein [Alphaproteobacteria bacterium]MBU0871642.1 mandelate racemase/muconate lactonizing enzyme family protein [Alphaproteobacteria bacterium]MBU1400309.1 mandelate racemase/muconate lactonizing enzyme family protein [Alphaproteobacteria bacterium]MBU1591429.1 mandelate racemase/muconate lactonizing enzyme family protein [Alphaprot
MSKIQSVTTGFFRIPLPEILTDSMHGTMRDFELVTALIRDEDGAEGVGYTFTVGRNGGAIANIIERELSEIVQGQDADLIEAIWNKIWWEMHYGGRGGPTVLALSAVDIALWDLKARKLGQPLWKLLGGFSHKVPCYAGGIDLLLPLPDLIKQTDGNLERGFRAIKMKVGRKKLSEDVERVVAMRKHLGDNFPLMADANMKWSADEAIRAARAFAPADLTWLEEPISPDDVAGHARVVREGGLPIAAGENLRTVWDFRHLIASGGVTYPEPDVTNCGGVTAFMKIAHLAEAFNLPVTSHGAHDITVHLLAAAPNRSYLEAHGFGLDRYIAEPLRIEDGFAIAPSRPGHGIEFDWKGLSAVQA